MSIYLADVRISIPLVDQERCDAKVPTERATRPGKEGEGEVRHDALRTCGFVGSEKGCAREKRRNCGFQVSARSMDATGTYSDQPSFTHVSTCVPSSTALAFDQVPVWCRGMAECEGAEWSARTAEVQTLNAKRKNMHFMRPNKAGVNESPVQR
ncbi:uncharacterized protein BP01DRAFT_365736 [Aspergillus saccharolyticus JOP 1030-1]|uniref:Uncharacterized protein n=1 Tax=Aspergillus saccharolyticus JOP 1030-1 TaxID=1450539 RepID=A0A318ZMY2_9EURO|nr:hypothetical protein BP01DRAFT_365736 [Aspergillus saccharolyticus JOP 1030-1]PYH45260.1 hypothetical protein BP01DRAFT_365736 [Aspergillus saccharolyticus JOP 1030-1]